MNILKSNILKALSWIIIAVLVLVVFTNYKRIATKIKAWRQGKDHDDSNVLVDVGGGSSVNINLQQTANEIFEALHGNMYGMTEDEETAISAILLVPKAKIKILNMYYASINGKGYSIYTDFKKYLSTSEYNKVKHLLS